MKDSTKSLRVGYFNFARDISLLVWFSGYQTLLLHAANKGKYRERWSNTLMILAELVAADLPAPPDHELLVGADVVDEEVHETQLLAEAHQHGEPAGMQGHAVGLFGELSPQVQGTAEGWGGDRCACHRSVVGAILKYF